MVLVFVLLEIPKQFYLVAGDVPLQENGTMAKKHHRIINGTTGKNTLGLRFRGIFF